MGLLKMPSALEDLREKQHSGVASAESVVQDGRKVVAPSAYRRAGDMCGINQDRGFHFTGDRESGWSRLFWYGPARSGVPCGLKVILAFGERAVARHVSITGKIYRCRISVP